MHFEICTLFPDFFTSPLQSSLLGKAQKNGVLHIGITNIRDFSTHPQKKVDDAPYGGGAGMVLQCEPVAAALRHVKKKYSTAKTLYLSPSGAPFTQQTAERLAHDPSPKILLCGHYEGIDERVLETDVDEILCVGEAVVTGGELPSLMVLDAVARLVPGVIGKESSHEKESFSVSFFGASEHPQYTRPEVWEGKKVPDVLLSGHHKNIENWQYENLKNLVPVEHSIVQLKRNMFPPQKPLQEFFKNTDTKKREKYFLRTHVESDIKHWLKWFNDEEITQFLRQNSPVTTSDQHWYYHWTQTNTYGLFLSIEDENHHIVGSVSVLVDSDSTHIAKFGLVLGEKSSWGKGLATAVTKKMMSIVFEQLKVKKIVLDVFAKNTAAIRVYEKCGFTKIGKIKKQYCKNGIFEDGLLYEKV